LKSTLWLGQAATVFAWCLLIQCRTWGKSSHQQIHVCLYVVVVRHIAGNVK